MRKTGLFLTIILVGLLTFSGCISMATQIKKKTGIDFNREDITKEEVLKLESPEFFKLWKKWKPIKLLMVGEEKKLVKEIFKIADEEQRNHYLGEFFKYFWTRRDDNSYDDKNRFKDDFYNRVIEAQTRFGRSENVYKRRCSYGIGWQNDLGLMYILLGESFDKTRYSVEQLMSFFGTYQQSAFMPTEIEIWYYEVPLDEYDGALFQDGVAWILFERDMSGYWQFGGETFSLFYNYENYRQNQFGGASSSCSHYIGEVYRFIEAVAKSYIYDWDLKFEDMFIKWVPVEEKK